MRHDDHVRLVELAAEGRPVEACAQVGDERVEALRHLRRGSGGTVSVVTSTRC